MKAQPSYYQHQAAASSSMREEARFTCLRYLYLYGSCIFKVCQKSVYKLRIISKIVIEKLKLRIIISINRGSYQSSCELLASLGNFYQPSIQIIFYQPSLR